MSGESKIVPSYTPSWTDQGTAVLPHLCWTPPVECQASDFVKRVQG